MKNKSNLLFVYGTLMQNIDSQITRFLKNHSQFLSEGTMKGRLYDLGRYPGAVYDENTDQVVIGQIFELKEAQASLVLNRLDEYEGVETATEYCRLLIPIETEQEEKKCWVYLYQKEHTALNLKLISSGNYLEYLSEAADDHWQFIRSVEGV